MKTLTTNEKLQFCHKSFEEEYDEEITFEEYVEMTKNEFEYMDNETDAETFEEYVDELYDFYESIRIEF